MFLCIILDSIIKYIIYLCLVRKYHILVRKYHIYTTYTQLQSRISQILPHMRSYKGMKVSFSKICHIWQPYPLPPKLVKSAWAKIAPQSFGLIQTIPPCQGVNVSPHSSFFIATISHLFARKSFYYIKSEDITARL